ncbi:hypothetical protein [Vibrio sp. MA40-2]
MNYTKELAQVNAFLQQTVSSGQKKANASKYDHSKRLLDRPS